MATRVPLEPMAMADTRIRETLPIVRAFESPHLSAAAGAVAGAVCAPLVGKADLLPGFAGVGFATATLVDAMARLTYWSWRERGR
jgi:hypothetical protein